MTATTAAPSTHTRVLVGASLMACLAGLTWSFGAVTAKSSHHADAWQYLIWRSIGIIVVVEFIGLARGKGWTLPKAFTSGKPMLLGCASLFLASIGFVYALKTTTGANAAFLSSITPLIAVILARIFLGERLTRVTIAAIALALLGLAVMVLSDLSAGNMAGNMAALGSAFGFAVYTVCVRSDPERDWSPALPGYAALMIVVCGIVTLSNGNTVLPPARDTSYALLHGAVFIVVGTLLFNAASRTVPAGAMAIFAQTETVFVPMWVFLVLDEQPKAATLLGGAIILTAIIGKGVLDARPANEHVVEPGPGSIA
ncbi:MAG: EamA family transporter [Actinobacteria bacterium]|nr:EamA family transporter [Actinomycetota bacterium]